MIEALDVLFSSFSFFQHLNFGALGRAQNVPARLGIFFVAFSFLSLLSSSSNTDSVGIQPIDVQDSKKSWIRHPAATDILSYHHFPSSFLNTFTMQLHSYNATIIDSITGLS